MIFSKITAKILFVIAINQYTRGREKNSRSRVLRLVFFVVRFVAKR